MKIALTFVVDLDDETELASLRDLRSHVATLIEQRREVRHVDDVHVTVDLAREAH